MHTQNDLVTTAAFMVGDWYVDPELCRMCRGDDRIDLRPKVIDVLVTLADCAGEVVRKETLLDVVWARKFVSETVLTRAIFELREAFGDDAGDPRVIETIPRRGYRLIAPVVRTTTRPASCDVEAACALIYGHRSIPLPEGEHIIGRDPEATLRIDSQTVSRRHALVTVAYGEAVLDDLGSHNGTFVAGTRVSGPTPLHSGDTILVGAVALVFKVIGLAGSTADVDMDSPAAGQETPVGG